ncbi:MAG: hypothetical protein ACRDTA_04815 [Pseudonocardiaceae bacterium]
MSQQHRPQRINQRRVIARAFQLDEAVPHGTDRITMPGQTSQKPLGRFRQAAAALPDCHRPLGLASA